MRQMFVACGAPCRAVHDHNLITSVALGVRQGRTGARHRFGASPVQPLASSQRDRAGSPSGAQLADRPTADGTIADGRRPTAPSRAPADADESAFRACHWGRSGSRRGQPHVSCRPADPRRHLRCAGGLDHGNLTLTGEYRDVLGRPAHRARDARLVPHLLDTTASIESRLLGGTALRVLGRRLQSPTRPVS